MKTKLKNVGRESFKQEVLDRDKLVVVDFYAEWCAPCRSIVPSLNELAEEYGDQLEVKKVNIDQEGELANEFGVASIPTLVFFRNSKEINRLTGARPKAALEDEFKSVLNQN